MTSVPSDKGWSYNILSVDVVKLVGLKATMWRVGDKQHEKKPYESEDWLPNRSQMSFHGFSKLKFLKQAAVQGLRSPDLSVPNREIRKCNLPKLLESSTLNLSVSHHTTTAQTEKVQRTSYFISYYFFLLLLFPLLFSQLAISFLEGRKLMEKKGCSWWEHKKNQQNIHTNAGAKCSKKIIIKRKILAKAVFQVDGDPSWICTTVNLTAQWNIHTWMSVKDQMNKALCSLGNKWEKTQNDELNRYPAQQSQLVGCCLCHSWSSTLLWLVENNGCGKSSVQNQQTLLVRLTWPKLWVHPLRLHPFFSSPPTSSSIDPPGHQKYPESVSLMHEHQ